MEIKKDNNDISSISNTNKQKLDDSKSSDFNLYKFNNGESIIKSSLLDNVACKVHGKDNIGIDKSNFSVICTNCLDSSNLIHMVENKDIKNNRKYSSSIESENENSVIDEEEVEVDDEESNPPCYQHLNTSSSFFCLDCSEFICVNCIVDKHRNHNSNLPSELRKDILMEIGEIEFCINQISKEVKTSLKSLGGSQDILKKNKELCNARISQVKQFITRELQTKNTDIAHSIQQSSPFSFKEIMTNKLYNNLESRLTRIKEYTDILEKIKSELILKEGNKGKNPDNNKAYKHFINDSSQKISEIHDYIYSINSIIKVESEKVHDYHLKLIENKLSYREELENKLKEIQNYYDSLGTSLFTSKFIKPVFLRRFTSFYKPGLFYFNNTGIFVSNLSDIPVNLSGLGLCGLVSSKTRCIINCQLSISVLLHQNSKQDKDLIKSVSEDFSDKEVQSSFKKIEDEYNDTTWKVLFKENILIKEIEESNPSNPVQNYFFQNYVSKLNKSFITLYPGYKYLISIDNLESEQYFKLWNGKTISKDYASMFREKKTSYLQQEVTCNNNSNVKFQFTSSMKTDLNEFSNGIICDLIYDI